MANIYVHHAAAGAADGTTWANAYTTLAAAQGADAAGDVIYISDAHTETGSAASSKTFDSPGTAAAPCMVIGADDSSGAPPTATSTTAAVITTTTGSITVRGIAYWYGINLKAGSSSSVANINLANDDGTALVMDNCVLELGGTSSTNRILIGSSTSGDESSLWLKDCTLKFSNTSQAISTARFCRFRMTGGSLSGSAILNLIDSAGYAGEMLFDGVDFSGGASSIDLVNIGTYAGRIVFRNCKMPTSWNGSLCGATPGQGLRVEMWNCAAGDVNYSFRTQTIAGYTKENITTYRDDGANDGVTPYSWEMVSTADAEYPHMVVESPEFVYWNDTEGSAINLIVLTATDNVTLTDDEFWIDCSYMGGSTPLITRTSTRKATVLPQGTGDTNQDPDTNYTWTAVPGTPVKQGHPFTITCETKGWVRFKAYLAKASTTVYVCPKVETY